MIANREVVRLKRVTKSPLVGCINGAVIGMVELRAFKKQDFLMKNFEFLTNEFNKNNLLMYSLYGWFSTRVVLSTLFFVLIPAYSYVLFSLYLDYKNVDMDKLVLFLITASQIADYLVYFLDQVNNVEVRMISVERCISYMKLKPEKNYLNFKIHKEKFTFPGRKLIKQIIERTD